MNPMLAGQASANAFVQGSSLGNTAMNTVNGAAAATPGDGKDFAKMLDQKSAPDDSNNDKPPATASTDANAATEKNDRTARPAKPEKSGKPGKDERKTASTDAADDSTDSNSNVLAQLTAAAQPAVDPAQALAAAATAASTAAASARAEINAKSASASEDVGTAATLLAVQAAALAASSATTNATTTTPDSTGTLSTITTSAPGTAATSPGSSTTASALASAQAQAPSTTPDGKNQQLPVPGTMTAAATDNAIDDSAAAVTSAGADASATPGAPAAILPSAGNGATTITAQTAPASNPFPPGPLAAPVRVDTLLPTPDKSAAVQTQDDHAFTEAVGNRVAWLADARIGHAEISVTPPDLGPIHVRLELDGKQVRAEFASAQPEIRAALEAGMPRLRDMLSGQGLQLTHAGVGNGNGSGNGNSNNAPGGSAAGSRFGATASENAASNTLLPGSTRRLNIPRGMLDEYA